MKKIIKISFLVSIILFVVTACGGGGGTANNTASNSVNKGYYIDSAVKGVNYDCGTQTGLTDNNGMFKFESGHSCKFLLAGKTLREVHASNLYDGIHIIERNVTVASVLLTLDKDGNASNGIEVPENAEQCIDSDINDINKTELHNCLDNNVSDYNGTEVDETEAQNHLNATESENKPQANNSNVSTDEDTSKNITLSATDPQNDTLTYIITQQPIHGNVTITGSVATYTPNQNYNGTDSFKFKVNDGSLDSNEATVAITINQAPGIHITDNNYQVIPLDCSNGSINTKVYLDSNAKSLYLVLTNTNASSSSTPTITHSNKIVQKENKKIPIKVNRPKIKPTPSYILKFNHDSIALLKSNNRQEKLTTVTSKSNSSVGDSNTFYLDQSGSTTTVATLKKTVSNVNTSFGNKTLNIWVSNDSFGSGCSKAKCLTQSMVDNLADKFLKSGSNNDIYDWVTNIYGEEWGSNAGGNKIGKTNTLDILLTDIDNDNSPNGGVIGYFWSKDNYKISYISGSNERIMFYIDSVMYANTDNGDFWQKEIYVTLAHEFQHMINFYQKGIYVDTETWLNEMMSVTTEDLVTTKLQHNGDRGVDYTDGSAGSSGNGNGRFPMFNQNIGMTITNWNNSMEDYAKVSSFGAFLDRNYGGAELFKAMIHNKYGDKQAITDAIKNVTGENLTFGELLQKWGVAIMLSDHENLNNNLPEYNIGDFFTSTLNGVTYQMGSINFFNYSPQPDIKTTTDSINPHANYYYKIGEDITDSRIDLNLTLDSGIKAVLIAK